MKKFLFVLLLLSIGFTSFADHIIGGEFYYYLRPGAPEGQVRYELVLKLYKETGSGAPLDQSVNFGIFRTSNGSQYRNVSGVPLEGPSYVNYSVNDPCFGFQQLLYEIGYYRTIVDLPIEAQGYTIAFQRCCRRSGIVNLFNSNSQGATYLATIPGTNQLNSGPQNSSPRFANRDSVIVCDNSPFSFDFSAVDDNGDSLVYYFCPGFVGGGQQQNSGCSGIIPNPACGPPYNQISYASPFSGTQPLGPTASINSATGIVSGISPNAGQYVVAVCVDEYRNGVKFNTHRKEFLLTVKSCNIPVAKPPVDFTSCDGFTVNFTNSSTGNITSYFWNFGDPSTLADTSLLSNPTYTFPDTGVYRVMLAVNRESNCSDTGYTRVGVYPGFFPGFVTAGICQGAPIQFTDTTKTRYGVVDSWRWDFGDPATAADTSRIQNPTYTYSAPGTYTVILRVTNSKGCLSTITRQVTIIDQPTLTMDFRDTTYCARDTLTLGATASVPSTYSWTPLINIINPNSQNPQVYPTTPTKYYVVADAGGCFARDSVMVKPRNDLATVATASPASICEGDTITLTGTANYSPITWQWSPANTVLEPNTQTTKAFPIANTTYVLTARWGNNCVATDSKVVTVKPLAVPEAGPDAYICTGQSSVQLNASGGDNYQWTPTTGLSNPSIPNPIASPSVTTIYTVSVGVTGCSARRTDSVKVEAKPTPALEVTNDTLICVIDTLQLNATGSGSVFWTPNYNINDQNSPTPLVSPDVSTTYYVTLTDSFGCRKTDSVRVNVTPNVNLFAGNDTTICQTDGIQLMTVSNGLRYTWTPSRGLSDSTAKRPIATPDTTTTYTVLATVGKCSATDDIKITTVPYPIANAGPDTAFCFGGNVQLQATGGDVYRWSPTLFLNNPNIPNPIASPSKTMLYTVSVQSTTSGCPKPRFDTVLVTVHPKVIADAGPRDTVIVGSQRLQLNGTGGTRYTWSPPTGLNNANIRNPIALLRNDQRYVLTVASDAGCTGTDTIDVIVYKVEADLFVPTAFTPNGDGLNDFFKPIPIGMKAINHFKVFNRWGVLMYSSTEMKGRGWDGTYNGRPQDSNTFVWIAEGVDYEDRKISKKGYVVLIR
jgi:gliding motility-associated-like protein